MHIPAMQIVKDLRKQVQALGLTPHAAARKFDMSDMTMRRFLAGGVPTLATLGKIEQRLARVAEDAATSDPTQQGLPDDAPRE